MTTHAQLAADMLRNAAKFFRNVGSTNKKLKDQMEISANTYDKVAKLVEEDPTGVMPGDYAQARGPGD